MAFNSQPPRSTTASAASREAANNNNSLTGRHIDRLTPMSDEVQAENQRTCAIVAQRFDLDWLNHRK